jgi:cytochrome c oxidase subunit 2
MKNRHERPLYCQHSGGRCNCAVDPGHGVRQNFTHAASAQAEPIDQLFHLELKVIAFLFSLIVVLMVYSIFIFRRKRGDTSDAAHIEGSTTLEIAWTVAPLATVMVFAYLGGNALAATLAPEPKPLRVEVIGKQWTWSFVYPDYG